MEHYADAVLAEIGGVVGAARVGDAEVHPARRYIRVVVNGVRLALAAGHAGTALDLDCAAVVRKLRGVVEGDEHLLAVDVAVVADAALRRYGSIVDKVPGRLKVFLVPVPGVVEMTGATVAVFGGAQFGVGDAGNSHGVLLVIRGLLRGPYFEELNLDIDALARFSGLSCRFQYLHDAQGVGRGYDELFSLAQMLGDVYMQV